MKQTRFLALVLAAVMLLCCGFSASAQETSFPREETLYVFDHWGTVNSWNVIGTNQNNGLAIKGNAAGSRTLVYETLYMYNSLDGSLTPLLASGDYVWNEAQTEMTVQLNPAAHWSDGTPVTAADVVKTWETSVAIGNSAGSTYSPYIASIEAVDDGTLVIHAAVNEAGAPQNPLMILDFLTGVQIGQKAWIETLEARCDGNATAMLNDKGEDCVGSGPYLKYYADDQKVAVVRDDQYWGQDASMWGKLPVPKYVVNPVLADNNAVLTAFKAGEIDVIQAFVPNVEKLWLDDGLPISAYMEEAPYGICETMPTAWYNMEIPALQNAAVRKAIALAVDYDAIIENAMTNQSPSFSDVPRSCMNPTDGEQALYDHEAVADLQWAGNDIDGAIALLDEAGIVDTDGDGWRELDGEKISLNACCPNGWSDWQAAMEIVAAAGQKIGLEITTLYPEWSVYQTVMTAASQTEYAIFMYSPNAGAPSSPWSRVRQFLSSEFVGVENNWSGNWGHYTNERADEIVAAIPTTTDPDVLKALYTEAVEIYLTEVPSFSLMYRPNMFYEVNESVWTNFPAADDGRGIPPTMCVDGYGIAALYDLELVNG